MDKAMSRVPDSVKETVGEEVKAVSDLTVAAIKSKAYLYPIKGLLFYLTHRELWKPLLSRIGPMLVMSVGVISSMFTFTYIPQAAVLALVNGPFAVVTTTLLILSESSTIITALSKTYLIQEALVDTFDAVLVEKDMTNVVASGRELRSGISDAMNRLGKLIKSPIAKYSPKALITYLMYLPLNLIPVVGTVIFIILQGKRSGPAAHARYFQLKNWSATKKEEWIEKNRAAYTSFGIVTSLLELVPVASILFAFTNATGAALMAADMEKKMTGTGTGDASMVDKEL